MLEESLSKRYQSAQEVLADLADLSRGSDTTQAETISRSITENIEL